VRWIARLAVVALLALLALRLNDRQAFLAAAGADLSGERRDVEHAAGYVDDLDARIDEAVARMRELDVRVSAFEARYPDGIPAAQRDEYDALLGRRNEVVSEHNELIVRRRSAVQDYMHGVGRHDAHVEDANALAAKSTPWRLVQGLWARVVGTETD
jgi:beta-glucosidase-like glycosyl hydrolase